MLLVLYFCLTLDSRGHAVALGWASTFRSFSHPGSFLHLLVSLALFPAGQGHGGGRRRETAAHTEALCAEWWVLATVLRLPPSIVRAGKAGTEAGTRREKSWSRAYTIRAALAGTCSPPAKLRCVK